MAFKDVEWGSVILGAAAVTALVAAAPAAVLTPLVAAGLSQGAVLGGAAITGGVAGDMVSKLCGRTQDAVTTLVHR